MRKHGQPQSLVLIGVQTSEKNVLEAFYQTPNMHNITLDDEKCMNMWKYTIIQVQNATRGQHKHLQHKWDKAQSTISQKILQKLSFPKPHSKTNPTLGFT